MASPLPQRLLIIAPTAPPEVCGVSDYAYRTAQELTNFYPTVTLGVERLPATPAVGPLAVGLWTKLLAQAAAAPQASDVLLNYTPTSYAWSGIPADLMRALRRFIQARPDNRLFVFFHETWNGSPNQRPHHALRSRATRWAMHRIGRLAEGVAVVNAEQQQKLRLLLGRDSIGLNAVGSNILPPTPDAGLTSTRQPGTWLVFGLPHTRFWALRAHLDTLRALHERGVLRQIHAIGPVDTTYARQELALISKALGPGVLVQLGALAPAEVSVQLLGAEAALVGLNADGLKKSGTFAALAAHAVPVICKVNPALAQPPGAALLQPAEVLADPLLVTNAEGERRRQQLHAWFWANRSWEAIGQALHYWLQNPT